MLIFFEYVLIAIYVAFLLFISHWIGQQAFSWMPAQATAEAQKIDDLFSFLVSIGAFIFLGLVSMMLYSVIFFRASPDDYSEGHPSRGDVRLEILWTATPTLLVMWIAFQGFNIYQQLNIIGLKQIVHLHMPMQSAPAYAIPVSDVPKPASETINVFAKQWDWSFRYPNNVTSHELHLPVNRSTRLNLNAQNVIHGFYIAEFRLKQDIIPNRDIEIILTPIRTGKFRLKDSQFSGTNFALMETDVYVESLEQYNQWLTQTVTSDRQLAKNQAVAEHTPPSKTFFQSGWYTVSPAQSPVITVKNQVNNDT
jgi:cytochrome c oxidase subunit 2